jgi:segregation and condensation protein B
VEDGPERLRSLLETLLFVSDGPVEVSSLVRSVEASERDVRQALAELRDQYAGRGIRLQLTPTGAQLVTAPENTEFVERFLGLEREGRLSTAALETLAIIAYRQPVTRPAIESIRGVNSDRAVATLEARELIEKVGSADSPGRPTLYRTTLRFLEYFGIEAPNELPPLPEPPAIDEVVAL